MPVSLQLERLRQALSGRIDGDLSISMAELADLDDAERNAVIDVVVAGEASPYVLMGGRVICTAGIQVDEVLHALD